MSKTFHVAWYRRFDWLIILIPIGFMAWAIADHATAWMLAAVLPIGALLAGLGIWVMGRTATRIDYADEKIWVKPPFRPPFDLGEFEFWRDDEHAEICAVERKIHLNLNAFPERLELTSLLNDHSRDGNRKAVACALAHHRVFRAYGFLRAVWILFGGVLGYVALIAVLADPWNSPKVILGALAVGTLLFCFRQAGAFSAKVSPEGVRVTRLEGTVDFHWDEIEWVIIAQGNTRTRQEFTRLEAVGKTAFLNGVFDAYPLLREIVVAQVEVRRPGRVLDKRPYAPAIAP